MLQLTMIHQYSNLEKLIYAEVKTYKNHRIPAIENIFLHFYLKRNSNSKPHLLHIHTHTHTRKITFSSFFVFLSSTARRSIQGKLFR